MDPQANPDVIKDIESPPVPTVTATTTAVPPATAPPAGEGNSAGAQDHQGTANGGGEKKAPVTQAIKQAISGFAQLETIDFLALNALFSWVEMIPSAQSCQTLNDNSSFTGGCPSYFMAYAVAVGAVTGTFNTIVFALDIAKKAPSSQTLGLLALFTFLWWIAGAIVLTFFNPYTTITVANGYFGTWAAFITAAMAFWRSGFQFNDTAAGYFDKLKETQKPSFFLFVSSTVVMGAAIGPCSPSSECVSWNGFAIALAVISQILCLFIMFAARRVSQSAVKMIAYFLILWWMIGTGVVTFGNPFKAAGNGYFASFASIFLAFVVARVAVNEPGDA